MAAFCLVIVMLLCAVACVTDWRGLRIPNTLSVAIVALFAVAALADPGYAAPLWPHLAAGGVMLLVTFGMFCAGLFGGGDAKLASALALWLGLPGIAPFVFFMGLAGGGLALAALYIKRKKPFVHASPESWVGQLQRGRNALPYGLAISAGFWAAVFHTPATARQLHEVIGLIH